MTPGSAARRRASPLPPVTAITLVTQKVSAEAPRAAATRARAADWDRAAASVRVRYTAVPRAAHPWTREGAPRRASPANSTMNVSREPLSRRDSNPRSIFRSAAAEVAPNDISEPSNETTTSRTPNRRFLTTTSPV